jgi:hypothetical protein
MRSFSSCAAVALAALSIAAIAGCSSSTANTGTSGGGTHPAPPTAGAQIDRMGRPAVNTALNHTFDTDDGAKGAAKDEYNANADPKSWSKYVGEMEANLAILDALDGTCGNQLFADKAKTDGTRYATLAGVLADDRLWVNTSSTTCTTYLGVEANATKAIPNQDCGGRKPSYDVIKLTYTIAAVGMVSTAVTDGTTPVPAKTTVATFPYLAAAAQ